MVLALLLVPFNRWENLGTERLNNLPVVTQLISSDAGRQARNSGSRVHIFSLYSYCLTQYEGWVMKDTNESLASGRQTGSEPEGEDPAWGPHIPDSRISIS